MGKNRRGDRFSGCDVMISCVDNDEAVEAVMTSSDGVIAAANLGAILLDMSTVSPQTSQRIHEAAKQRNLPILDAAVLGSTLQAKEGSLLILIFAGGRLCQAA